MRLDRAISLLATIGYKVERADVDYLASAGAVYERFGSLGLVAFKVEHRTGRDEVVLIKTCDTIFDDGKEAARKIFESIWPGCLPDWTEAE